MSCDGHTVTLIRRYATLLPGMWPCASSGLKEDFGRHGSDVQRLEIKRPLAACCGQRPDALFGASETRISLVRLRPRRARLCFSGQQYRSNTMYLSANNFGHRSDASKNPCPPFGSSGMSKNWMNQESVPGVRLGAKQKHDIQHRACGYLDEEYFRQKILASLQKSRKSPTRKRDEPKVCDKSQGFRVPSPCS